MVKALKSLQQKIRRMELEEKETEENYQQLSHDVTDQKEISPSRSLAHQPGPHGSAREGKGGVFLDAVARSVSKGAVCVNRISLKVAICGGPM